MILMNTLFYALLLSVFVMVEYFTIDCGWLVLFYFMFVLVINSVSKLMFNRVIEVILALLFTTISILYMNTLQAIAIEEVFILFFVCYLPLLQLGESIRYKRN